MIDNDGDTDDDIVNDNDVEPNASIDYTKAIGYVAKVASAKSMDKSIGKLQTWYLEKPPEERTLRRAIAWTFGAISKHALDQLKAHASSALPLVFFASHAPAEEGEEPAQGEAAIWSEVWNEVTPGMEQGIHLYLKVGVMIRISHRIIDEIVSARISIYPHTAFKVFNTYYRQWSCLSH